MSSTQKKLWQFNNSNLKSLSSRYYLQQILGKSLYLDIYTFRIAMFLSSQKNFLLSSKLLVNHMFQLSHFEREAPIFRGHLPSSRLFLQSAVLRLFCLNVRYEFFLSITLFVNSMWKSWIVVTKLSACAALGHHPHNEQSIRVNKSLFWN